MAIRNFSASNAIITKFNDCIEYRYKHKEFINKIQFFQIQKKQIGLRKEKKIHKQSVIFHLVWKVMCKIDEYVLV